jgi:putative ABC transport system permease protein
MKPEVTSHRWSRRLYRVLLACYPRDFRSRFAGDLERDFAELLARRGRRAAWGCVLIDLLRSIPLTHRHAGAERRRIFAMTQGGEPAMGSLMVDLRYAVRSLIKAPVFAGVTVLTLALGIGANSAIFSLLNAVLLRPTGLADADRLMLIHEVLPASKVPRFGVSPADYLDLARLQTSFEAIGAYRLRSFELSGAGEPVTVAQVSATVLPILGVNAAAGRTFLPDEDQAAASVVVLTSSFARRRFGGQPAVGARIVLDRRPYTVVGVMPASFQFPRRGAEFNGEAADLYMPLVFTPFERQARGMFYTHSVIGRLRDGVSVEQAAADVSALAPRVIEGYSRPFILRIVASPFLDEIAGAVRRPLMILLAAVGLVLMVACANVANLMLSRAVARRREIGVRVALGAARHRLFQMLLIESLLLALAGGLLGLLLGHWTLRAMPSVIASSLPAVGAVALDARVLAFTFALSLLTAAFFGLVPLASGRRRDLNDVLREGAARTMGARGQHRLQSALVVSSIAFAFVLLAAAGLLIRSAGRLMAVEVGANAPNVVTMEVALPNAAYSRAATIRAFYQRIYDQLRAIPGVRAASISTDLPIRSDGERRQFAPSHQATDAPRPPSVAVTWIHGDYFTTFGIPLRHGRSFTPEEQIQNRSVAIVSRALADAYWPGQDPIGKQVKWGDASSPASWQTVVGVAEDVVDGPLGAPPVIHIYVPYAETPDQAIAAPTMGLLRRMILAVQGDADPRTLIAPARAAVASLDAALAVDRVTTMAQVIDEASAPQRFSAAVLSAFAAGALLLAGIGLYGVLAFTVSQRTREIGVRVALGAARGEVMRLIVGEGMTLAAIGLVLGGAAAIGATRLLRSMLFETDVYDPWTFAVVPALLASVALAACALPARRAADVDPMVALRNE